MPSYQQWVSRAFVKAFCVVVQCWGCGIDCGYGDGARKPGRVVVSHAPVKGFLVLVDEEPSLQWVSRALVNGF